MTDFETNTSLGLDDELLIDLTEPPQEPERWYDASPEELRAHQQWYQFGRFVGATAVVFHRQEAENEALRKAALRDDLTGLYNRAYLEQRYEKLQAAFVHRRRGDAEDPAHCLMVADADYFKQVNDVYGHDVGDIVLIRLSQILGEEIHRDEDIIARLGGEEFGILLPNTSLLESQMLAERVRQSVKSDWILREVFMAAMKRGKTDALVPLSISLGITKIEATMPYAVAYHQADLAMYSAKRNGRDQVFVY